MPLAIGSRALVVGLLLTACASGFIACSLETSGIGGADVSSTGSGGTGGSAIDHLVGAGGAGGDDIPVTAGGEGGAGGVSEPTGTGGGTSSITTSSSSASTSSTSSTSSSTSSSSTSSSSTSSSSGGGSNSDPCGSSSTLALKDDFNDNKLDLAKWTAYADPPIQVLETGMQVVVKADKSGKGGGYVSSSLHSLHDCHVFIEVSQVVNSVSILGPNAVVYFLLYRDSGKTHLGFEQRGGQLKLVATIDGKDNNQDQFYSASLHRWWRFRESSGKITWDTSPDGHTWNTQRTLSTSDFGPVDNLKLDFGAIGGLLNPHDAQFDNVNVSPP